MIIITVSDEKTETPEISSEQKNSEFEEYLALISQEKYFEK